jgi:hypothetical protein
MFKVHSGSLDANIAIKTGRAVAPLHKRGQSHPSKGRDTIVRQRVGAADGEMGIQIDNPGSVGKRNRGFKIQGASCETQVEPRRAEVRQIGQVEDGKNPSGIITMDNRSDEVEIEIEITGVMEIEHRS